MLVPSLLVLALAASGLAQAPPAGYKKVYITSMVNTKFVMQPKTTATGSTMVVQSLTSKPEQQWYLKDGVSKIMLVDTKMCLDAGPKAGWKDMANIFIKECSDTEEGQNWNVMADGRIALEASKPQECIDLQYMRATAGNAVGLYACAGLGNTGAKDKGINWPLSAAT